MEINELLFGTVMKEPERYENRYVFKGNLKELSNNGFELKKEKEKIEELKIMIGKDDEVYYKKSGCGYFIIYKDMKDNKVIFMSGVPVWWIGDENLTNYYEDVENLIKADLVEEVSNELKKEFGGY